MTFMSEIGADLSLQTDDGDTAIDLATENNAPAHNLKLLGAANAPHLHTNTEEK